VSNKMKLPNGEEAYVFIECAGLRGLVRFRALGIVPSPVITEVITASGERRFDCQLWVVFYSMAGYGAMPSPVSLSLRDQHGKVELARLEIKNAEDLKAPDGFFRHGPDKVLYQGSGAWEVLMGAAIEPTGKHGGALLVGVSISLPNDYAGKTHHQSWVSLDFELAEGYKRFVVPVFLADPAPTKTVVPTPSPEQAES
jgi:hypothetical protein